MPEPRCSIWYKTIMRRDLVEVGFYLRSKALGLGTQFDVVVKNLLAFFRRNLVHIDYDLRFLHQWERGPFKSLFCPPINIVSRRKDDASSAGNHRLHFGEDSVPLDC